MLSSEIESVKVYLRSIGEFWSDESSEFFYPYTIDFDFRNVSIKERFENELAGVIDYSLMYYEVYGINILQNIYEQIQMPILEIDKYDNFRISIYDSVSRMNGLTSSEALYNIEEILSFNGIIEKYTHVRLITLWDDCPGLSSVYQTEGLIDVSKPVRIELLDFLENVNIETWKKEIQINLDTSFLILKNSKAQHLVIEVEMSSEDFEKLDGTDLWLFLNRNLTLFSYTRNNSRKFFMTRKRIDFPLIKVKRLLKSKSIDFFLS